MRKKQIRIKPGDIYGVIQIIGVDESADRKLKSWHCRCTKCGSEFSATGQSVFKNQNGGCCDCRKMALEQEKINNAKSYIGQSFGHLRVDDFAGMKKPYGKITPVMKCYCTKCGEYTDIPLVKLKTGQANECANCARKNLKYGHEISELSHVDGTQIIAIDGRRSLNKNSTSGINGVSFIPKSGKYRAYINFKRKQYYLGAYENIEDAVAARKAGEKAIYGDFLKWYAETHPEQWEKLKK